MNKRIIIQDLISDTGQVGNVTVIGDDTPAPTPTGTISITENGSYDVSGYAEAEVEVAGSGGDQTISFLDWVREGCNTYGDFQSSTTRIACKHMLFKCKSISIPSGLQFSIAASIMPIINNTNMVYATSSRSNFQGFWNGTEYTNSFTWFDTPTFDLTQILGWSDNYFVMFLRHQDNSEIQPSEGNSVVVTYDLADRAFVS